jgi:hypothetical protein
VFTGSGHIEAACKQIVVQRAKQSGMHWSVEGTADIVALRCEHAGGSWTGFVAHRPAPAAGSAQPSNRHRETDPQVTNPSKIIPNNAVVHPSPEWAACQRGLLQRCVWLALQDKLPSRLTKGRT